MSGDGATSSPGAFMEVRDIHKWYGGFHALRGVSQTVEKGEVLVVCGPSGSGKSTLIRCLNRLEEIDKGVIFFDGRDIHRPDADVNRIRAEIGIVFQDFNLYPHLSILGNVTLAPRKVKKAPGREAEALALELLDRVGIPRSGPQTPGRFVRRAAAARGHCPGPGHAPQPHAFRRTHLGPGSGDDRRSAERDEGSGPGGH